MKEFVNAKKTYIVLLAVFFVFVSLSETTYSLFLKSDSTDEFGYNTGLLDLKFVEDEAIKLENAFPIPDSEGVKLKPYILTLKNTGSLPYLYDLKMLGEDDSIDYKYIKVKVNDGMAHTLYSTNNVLLSNNIIYPNEEVTFRINVWLDSNTPNTELGKTFSAKVTTSGSSTYKTLDSSGANYPVIASGMIPIYFNNVDANWHIADKNNMNVNYTWYDYNNKQWANVVTLRDSDKYIFDIMRRSWFSASGIPPPVSRTVRFFRCRFGGHTVCCFQSFPYFIILHPAGQWTEWDVHGMIGARFIRIKSGERTI